MQTLNDISIKKKLMLVTMLAVMTAMSVACTAFVINDARVMKADLAQQLLAITNVLGTNSVSALASDDGPAERRLLESLVSYPVVRTAVVYNARGALFAVYPEGEPDERIPPPPQQTGYQFRRGHLEVASAIASDGKKLGTIYIEGDLAFIWRQMLQYAAIVVTVLIVSCGAAYVLASRLQRVISGPVLNLTRTAQAISQQNDYGIRVAKEGNDELGALCDEFNHMLDQVQSTKQALQQARDELEVRVIERTRQLSKANAELSKQVAERLRAERELEVVHREFVDAARRAGMAEIATGVLHNVGNVLNSVNVSATMLANRLKSSKLPQLTQVVSLLDQHSASPGDFIDHDEKGKQIPRFLKVLSEHLVMEEDALLEEARSLIANVEHIKAIVSTQQSYATSAGFVEPADVNAILDDAVRLNFESFSKHGIEVRRHYTDLPFVLIDKQRVLQIVINLVKNAKEALIEHQCAERVLTLRTLADNDRLLLEVRDSGSGIKTEDLARVFAHGFTTKASGHGFGLHSCANAATEMDGCLSVHSDGPLKGASFTLNLPLRPAAACASQAGAAPASNNNRERVQA